MVSTVLAPLSLILAPILQEPQPAPAPDDPSAERARDALERETGRRTGEPADAALFRLFETRAGTADADASSLAAALPERAAAATWHVVTRTTLDGAGRTSERLLLALVLRRDGALRRVEAGPTAAVEEAVERWRAAIGAPAGGASATAAPGPGAAVAEAGNAIRMLVLDPVLRAAGEAETLHVVLAGALHRVPLDALPLGDGAVGDRIAIREEVCFARLVAPPLPLGGEPTLLAIGGIDFGAGARFRPLPESEREVAVIGDSFLRAFGREPISLRGERATKATLREKAPAARFLHLATHGLFDEARAWDRRVAALSPFALCGLALAGANGGPDALGRVPGILTGEEIAGIDLRGCALAVLSAGDTHVGLDRGDLDITSLRAALHRAGVRASITSRWQVDDARTRELVTDFYRRLWVEKQPVAAALWDAKRAARAKGWPVRDWAAWVLTGDPGGA